MHEYENVSLEYLADEHLDSMVTDNWPSDEDLDELDEIRALERESRTLNH